MTDSKRLSVVIITQNEEEKIEQAILSCRPFADDIVVVDGGSTDGTVLIAERLGCSVYHNPWPGYAKQRIFGADQAPSNWIFVIDSDEEVSEELQKSLLAWKKEPENEVKAYTVYRIGDFLGRWMPKGEHLVRLYKKDEVRMKDVLVHEGPDVDPSAVPCLSGTLWHHGYRSIQDHVQRFNKYTDLEARKDYDRGKAFSLLRLLLRPPAKLIYTLFVRRMITKGIAGFSVAFFWMYYEFLKEIKLYELHARDKKREKPVYAIESEKHPV
ncbi:glycosyltransferase involved in cell wall biosynthesis [Paenibacillus forsythiae]|uniref:Glycosyltransferase involved in cell wall biosynthesis n=1 Tax=Paenibacillus forsythiae TaxID=365616 RepID=A0ABU3H8Z3_9BACL|nr:glycosyltransferase family 2 protein [Paenibacillus forsythiae]MDT3427289.1 glycosyltransferase involved in cell wall biosynthesis [Paenibacillus forsythiae]